MILNLIKGDIKNIKRDPILVLTVLGPLLLTFVLRFGLPFVTTILNQELNFDLKPYYTFIIGFFLMLTPMLIGAMTGLLLLEDKDENMFLYYAVTPLSKEGYLFYKLSLPLILNILLSFFMVYLSNVIALSFLNTLIIIIMASLQAMMMAFFLTAFAENRVEGLAMTKAMGFLFFFPLLDQFYSHFIFKLSPTYWVPKALEFNAKPEFVKILLLGFIVHFIYLTFLYYYFNKKIQL